MGKAGCHAAGRERGLLRAGVNLVALVLALAVSLPAQQAPVSPAPIAPAPQQPPLEATRDYIIGPQDLLLVSILESAELSREARVNADGTINLPLLERVMLQGLTLTEAEEVLEKRYRDAGILNDPHITLTVKELQSKPVTVMGAVRTTGVFQMSGQSRLLRVISMAGGLTDDAGEYIQVLRADGKTGESVLRISTAQVRAGDPETNVPVWGGDTVNVMPAGAVYVVGAVNRPGRHSLGGQTDGVTVLRLIAMAEDLKRTARADKAVLIRKDAAGSLQQIPVDVRKILAQKQGDVAVLPNDVLFVPDSAGKRALARGLEAALQIATSVTILGVI
jgi:polysaccharide export outer membrane protein